MELRYYIITMKSLKISNGKYSVIIDNDDYETLALLNWNKHKLGYAYRLIWKNGKCVGSMYMHRIILHEPVGIIDHINRNRLDNRKCNLRITNKSMNALNAPPQNNNTSGHRGIDCNKRGKWIARIKVNKKQHYLGCFATKEQAIACRKKFIKDNDIISE